MSDAAESVWDYPRPPRLEPTASVVRIVHCGVVIAETTRALRILETSHPPVFYLPQADIAMQWMKRSARRQSFCEFKGFADYWTIDVSGADLSEADVSAADVSEAVSGLGVDAGCKPVSADAAWSYPQPSPKYAALRDHLAFYASRVSECWVDGERVTAQPGDFYGGWITARVKGPFKGAPGTMGW